MITEQDVYRALMDGTVESPCQWQNSVYIRLRLSGTGVAWRASCSEYVFRDPKVWCAPEMLRRFLSLPIVISHPVAGTLTSRDFGNTCVGIVVHVYVDAEENAPWGIGRVLDRGAAQMIAEGRFCTSPGVIISPENCAETTIDGQKLLVEGASLMLDHIALVDMGEDGEQNRGVWQRDDGPGVDAANTQADNSARASA